MDHKVVSDLERELEEAICSVLLTMGLKRLPLLPSRPTMHLMAKAAASVYEAVVDHSELEDRDRVRDL